MATRGTVLIVALATLIGPMGLILPATGTDQPEVFDTAVPSFDEHDVPVRVYTAEEPGPGGTAPTLLWGPGWNRNHSDSAHEGAFFAGHGYNVVALEFRGFGSAAEASSARLLDPAYEIQDTRAVIDWIAEQPWAETTGDADPVLGVIGRSYGGSHALLAAAFDDRIDAIAPRLAWNDLAQSVAPNDVIQSVWIDLIYWSGKTSGMTLHEDLDHAYQDAMVLNRLPAGDGPSGVDVVSWFADVSPASYEDRIDIPALIIQGVPDVLFNLNEAVANFQLIERAGGEAFLFTTRAGHILNTGGELSALPGAEMLPPVGLQPPPAGSPCGDFHALTLAFFDHYLRAAGPFDHPRVTLATDDGGCITADQWPPVPSTEIELADPVVVTSAGGGALVPVALPVGASTIAGVPHLSGDLTTTSLDTIVHLSLVALGPDGQRTLDSQVTPLRASALGDGEPRLAQPLELDLFGVGASLSPDESLFLRIDPSDPQFVHNGQRAPGTTILEGLTLELPVSS